MSNQFQVGKTYKLVDVSKCVQTAEVIGNGALVIPDTFVCHHVDSDGDCYSTSAGVTWRGNPSPTDLGVMCGLGSALVSGAIEEVTDAS